MTKNKGKNKMKYFNIIALTLLLSACAKFETLMNKQQIQGVPDQLTCAPADSLGCAGWNTKED